ncbi:unnamed protein product [Ranitomeya imitator]|uniref:G-protein coupled receptors family 1 profile domain-containing protein n=1 Tax=Ranitomeya imitator TaxID=111125 RepID=A0ABN9KWR3_9NEOB|nr:unnamed protein product [Ranitomeya imitator]
MENSTTAAYPTSGIPLLMGTSNPTDYYYYDISDEEHAISSINYLVLVMYSLTLLLGTLGNGLVIWIAIFRMKKTVNVIWFLNLSIVDLFFVLFLPLRIIYMANGFNWLFGNFMCKFSSMVAFINLYIPSSKMIISFVINNFELDESSEDGIYRQKMTVMIRLIVGFCIPFTIIVT